VKFHLDSVKELGEFVEIEAIDAGGTLERETLLAQCQEYLRLFAIRPQELIATSYSDLLIQQSQI
jgi:adenylate cyclase class IV